MKLSIALLGAVATSIIGISANAATSWERPGAKVPPILHSTHVPGARGNNGIVGTWLASYDGGVHTGYLQWQKGGTVQDMMDFAAKTGNVQFGDWSTDGRGTYTATLTGMTFDTKGNTRTGIYVKTEDDVLSGDSYSGTFEVTYYDLDGNILFQHDGNLTAARVGNQ